MKYSPFKISITREIFEFFYLVLSGSFHRNSDKTILISQENKNEEAHINAIVNEIEDSFLADSKIKKQKNSFRILSGSSKLKTIMGKLINHHVLQKNRYFAILMGPDFGKIQPFNLMASQLDIYMFDAWPPDYFPHIEEHIKKLKISHIFFSSKQVTEIFRDKQVPNCYWIPEAVDNKKYHFYDYAKKDIDIIQFGRKYDFVHEELLKKLNAGVFKYMVSDGKLLFNSDAEFKEGLARTKISLCFPASLTHPEKANGISTMTTRYLQSMASKCLVVGIMPDEMKELFGYTPIVELNLEDPGSHLCNILDDFSSYIPLIEKNYYYILEHHSWLERWETIKKYI
jgi:hypothetical protein